MLSSLSARIRLEFFSFLHTKISMLYQRRPRFFSHTEGILVFPPFAFLFSLFSKSLSYSFPQRHNNKAMTTCLSLFSLNAIPSLPKCFTDLTSHSTRHHTVHHLRGSLSYSTGKHIMLSSSHDTYDIDRNLLFVHAITSFLIQGLPYMPLFWHQSSRLYTVSRPNHFLVPRLRLDDTSRLYSRLFPSEAAPIFHIIPASVSSYACYPLTSIVRQYKTPTLFNSINDSI